MKMDLKFGNSFQRIMKQRIEGYEFEVGILSDGPHRNPVYTPIYQQPNLGNYAGDKVRKTTNQVGPLSKAEIFIENMKRMGVNLLTNPFKSKSNSEIRKFTRDFLRFAFKRGVSQRRLENLLQAIVRNPILRQDYGPNTSATADSKGFDRHLIDTGQMFKSIRARLKNVRK